MSAASLGINPGDVLNPNGTVSVGLLPNVGVAAGTGLVANPDGITGTSWAQRNYVTTATVLNGGTIGASTNTNAGSVGTNLPDHVTPCAAGGVNCQNTIYVPASGPTFNLLGDSLAADTGTTSNFWYSLSTGTTGASIITIPVGIFGVNSIATMLNTAGGVTTGGTVGGNAAAYASITFKFNATDATGLTGTNVTETLALINGVTQRNVLSGLGGYASTTSASYTATDLGTNAGATYTVLTGNEWTGTVNSSPNGAPAVNSTMVLDYQVFPVLNNYKSMFLVSVSITDTGTASGANFSREMLSGITITQTPEPSTVLMFLSGFGALGIARFRRNRS